MKVAVILQDAKKTELDDSQSPDSPSMFWALPAEDVLDEFDVSPEEGLSSERVAERLDRYGPNVLREIKSRSAFEILVAQFRSLVVGLLVVASLAAAAFGEWLETIAIAVVLALNAAIGFTTEWRALRSMEALRQLSRVETVVRRNGQPQSVDAGELVPGDIVQIEAGDIVSADIRLVQASGLQANEAALTGESTPVGKSVDALEVDTPLADRRNMLFNGTGVARGSGLGVVVATGMSTELGHISELVEQVEDEVTPLEQQLSTFGRRLVWLTLVLAALVAIAGYLGGKELFLIIETSIALAVAAVPEGLPIIATVAMARGIRRMAQRNALIRRLSSVETLGATTIICTDKTGTLTEDRMLVVEIVTGAGNVSVGQAGADGDSLFSLDDDFVSPSEMPDLEHALLIGVLCNDATLGENEHKVGDPVEVALLEVGRKGGIERPSLVEDLAEVREEAFDPEVRMMATVHRKNGGYLYAIKGGPEAVLERCNRVQTSGGVEQLDDAAREEWHERNESLAANGLRVLALAYKTADSPDAPVYEDLIFVAQMGFLDPPRGDVADTIAACRAAGIKVVMITGDHPATAGYIARQINLTDDPSSVVVGPELDRMTERGEYEGDEHLDSTVFARVTPQQKLDLIDLYRRGGHVVAMTGDGVNDAPALRSADIGVAMGQRGTDVAREAADMVLQDDALSSIVEAIYFGRVIFRNIRAFVMYLLSCNVSEVMVVGLATVVGAPLPLLPLQILYLNLITDVFPALALGVGRGSPAVMEQPPRDPQEAILTNQHWRSIAVYGGLITGSTLFAFFTAYRLLDLGTETSVTISFLTLALSQLWHVFNMRAEGGSIFRNEITTNPYVWGALSLSGLLLLSSVYLPGLSGVLETTRLGVQEWLLVVVMSLVPLVIGQALRLVRSPNRW